MTASDDARPIMPADDRADAPTPLSPDAALQPGAHVAPVSDVAGTACGLDALARGEVARVVGFQAGETSLEMKLREIGFAEGDEVELMARGALGGTPVSVRLNRTVIALRRGEAALIQVLRLDADASTTPAASAQGAPS